MPPSGRLRRSPTVEALEARDLPTLLGSPVFPADNPWNQRVDAAPVASNSSTLVASIGVNADLHPDFGSGTSEGAFIGIPYIVVDHSQPAVDVIIGDYADESDLIPVPLPDDAPVEGDPQAADANRGDRHLVVSYKAHPSPSEP